MEVVAWSLYLIAANWTLADTGKGISNQDIRYKYYGGVYGRLGVLEPQLSALCKDERKVYRV